MRKIGKFELVRPFASNPSEALFEARGDRLGRCVVLLLPRLHAVGVAQVVPFLDGAPAIAALRHPNIARVHDAGIEDGLPYVVIEPLLGMPLDRLIRSRPTPSAEWKVRVMSQVCDAVAHAHAQDVVHLDLRPANVFVTAAGEVKVVGFGVAPLRVTGLGISTIGEADLQYAAPEQLAGGSVDHRADVFAAGALAYELFSDRPFRGGESTPFPETEYSPRLEAIVMKALASNPADRQQRMAQMQKAMDDLLYNSADAFFERMLQRGARGRSERVQVLYGLALGQATEGRFEEASKLARAIRQLAPDDPRNEEMTAYLLAEAETAVKKALASSPTGPRARVLRQRLERLLALRSRLAPAASRPAARSAAGH